MTKKIISIALILVFVFSMSTFITDVNANTQNEAANISNTKITKQELQTSDNNSGNNLSEEANTNANIQNKASNLGRVQYTITEAPGPSEGILNEETKKNEQIKEEVVITEDNTVEEKINKRKIDPNKPMIAITYDDGPSKYTPEILDVLKENNSSATFFVLGSQVNRNKDILVRMLEEGNQIGNHTYNHKKLTTISDEELYKQIRGTDDLIYRATGYTPSIMRPPYGATNEELNKKIQKPVINWSIDTRDWENRNTEIIVNSILEDVKDGDIILMHDLYDTTAEASKIVIPELVKRGYQLVTVEELFEYKEATATVGMQYYNVYK